MVKDILPEHVLKILDKANVVDDNMQFVPAEYALRALHFNNLLERITGIKPRNFSPYPLVAQLEFTQLCNLKCDFCYNESGNDNHNSLSSAVIEKLCYELIELKIIELIISGGEPLVEMEKLKLILDIFINKNITIHLLTNGILLSDEKLKWLSQYPIATIQVSLDGGNPGIHDSHRNRKGAWEKTFKGIVRAHQYGFYTIVACTITKNNVPYIEDLIDYCYMAGIKEVVVGDIITWGRAVNWMNEGVCTNEQLDDTVEMLQRKYLQYKGFMSIKYPVNMLYYISNILLNGQESILIRGNGDVIPHCTLSEIVAGNVNNNSVAQIWNESLKKIVNDDRVLKVFDCHELILTERFRLLRCIRKN
jgi:MoaA/NifB/PqqE/SkfB family radical SAM enzyme